MYPVAIFAFTVLATAPPSEQIDDERDRVASAFAKSFYDKYDFAKVEPILAKKVVKLKASDQGGRAFIKLNGPILADADAKTVEIIRAEPGKIGNWLLRVREAAPDFYGRNIPADLDRSDLPAHVAKGWPQLFKEIENGGTPFCIIGEVEGGFRGGIIIVVRHIESAPKITLVDDQ